MNKHVRDETRRQILRFLPSALRQALASYHTFSGNEIPEDSKGFSAHHNACKVAVAHIELLLKLANWAFREHEEEMEGEHKKAFQIMLQNAEEEVAAYREKNTE